MVCMITHKVGDREQEMERERAGERNWERKMGRKKLNGSGEMGRENRFLSTSKF